MFKHTIILFFVLSFAIACNSSGPEPAKAATFIEGYITTVENGNYANLRDYYSDEMKDGETDDERISKLNQIKDGLGTVKSFEQKESKADFYNDEKAITLIYAVKRNLMTVTETFTVIKDGNDLKIAKQNVVSIK